MKPRIAFGITILTFLLLAVGPVPARRKPLNGARAAGAGRARPAACCCGASALWLLAMVCIVWETKRVGKARC